MLAPGKQCHLILGQSHSFLVVYLFNILLLILLIARVIHMKVEGAYVLLWWELIISSSLYILEHVSHHLSSQIFEVISSSEHSSEAEAVGGRVVVGRRVVVVIVLRRWVHLGRRLLKPILIHIVLRLHKVAGRLISLSIVVGGSVLVVSEWWQVLWGQQFWVSVTCSVAKAEGGH